MAEIRFSPDALEDLKGIKAYIAQELMNEQAASDTVSAIMKRVRQLSEFPKSGMQLSSVIGLGVSWRFIVCGSYTAFYRFENGEVYVSRVLYGRRDYMRILFDDGESRE